MTQPYPHDERFTVDGGVMWLSLPDGRQLPMVSVGVQGSTGA